MPVSDDAWKDFDDKCFLLDTIPKYVGQRNEIARTISRYLVNVVK